jgi:hypothetical protein
VINQTPSIFICEALRQARPSKSNGVVGNFPVTSNPGSAGCHLTGRRACERQYQTERPRVKTSIGFNLPQRPRVYARPSTTIGWVWHFICFSNSMLLVRRVRRPASPMTHLRVRYGEIFSRGLEYVMREAQTTSNQNIQALRRQNTQTQDTVANPVKPVNRYYITGGVELWE